MKLPTPLAVVFCFVFGAISHAGTLASRPSKEIAVSDFPYEKGDVELQLMAGYIWDLQVFEKQPKINYAFESLSMGYMLGTPRGSGFLRGNWEAMLEAFGGEVTNGPGSVIVGGALNFRYNFVQPNAKIVPYIQGGGGGLYNDVAHHHEQQLIGSTGEFFLDAALGVRWHLNEKWALDLQARYNHISNAGLATHNLGLNSLGMQAGFSYFFH